ncbi:progestin and adipoQ receptor family member 4 isoform X2 [Alosa pseudoharengus]|uniref:progestin and adipoQ receptor family member 4 isoform X2 n=1 Tax=Alosa pseudoharengus TaxID=34774 RepID=UPI003F8C2B93
MDFVKKPKLLDFKSSPPHLQFNDFVLTGYRPVSTLKECLHSLFYLHNEFGNIYTHGSVLYHLFMNHEGGEPIYDTLLSLDMFGVCLVNTLGALPIIHITLLCYPDARRAALLAYVTLSLFGVHSAVTARSNMRRLQSFFWQALFRVFLYALRWYGPGTGSPDSMHFYATMDSLAVLGGLVNVVRMPERLSPGSFDYWLNSHQIMHMLVALSIVYLHWGMMEDLVWLRTFECPPE